MIKFLKKDHWSPYLVGALIGVLSWITFLFFNHQLGSTVAFQKFVGILYGIFDPKHIEKSNYYHNYFSQNVISWQQMLLIGLFLGTYISRKLSNSKRVEYVPVIWEKNFGKSKTKRYIGAFIGGFLLLFGARLSGGCTSGHVISGGMQLALSSWVFLAVVFPSAIVSAFIIYRKR